MGIRDKIDKGNINETYYSGFFAILSISQYEHGRLYDVYQGIH